MNKKIKDAIATGANFLAGDQSQNGSFMCLTSEVFDDYTNARVVPAIVPPNVVLSSLVHIPETPIIKKVKDKTAKFLLTQRGEYWSFNYWFKNSKEFTEIPYPDDLDDTFCALAALYEYDPSIFNGNVMGKIVTMLTTAELAEGGPYNMWLVPKRTNKNWEDMDLVVNSNVGFFLHLHGISLPGLNSFIEKSIDEEDYEFPYNTIYPGVYFVSRFYKGEKTKKMIGLLLSKKEKNGAWQNPLRTALAVSSLLNLSDGELWPELTDSIEYLLKTQKKDGSWECASFFYQMKLKEKTLFAGSASTTTALCMEALQKYLSAQSKVEEKESIDMNEQHIYEAITKKFKERFKGTASDLNTAASSMFDKMVGIDKDRQIFLLPYFFRKSLGEKGKKVSDELVIDLGYANLLGWMAYTIYDDFLDKEGNPQVLSVANVCMREFCVVFNRVLPNSPEFSLLYHDILDGIDGANTWEVCNCHTNDASKQLPDFKDYSTLAHKSLGHALGPIAILFSLRYKKTSKEVEGVLEFFKHYLIARQLNDDAHDWQDDLNRGYMNSSAVLLFKELKGKKTNKELMEITFWEKTILKVTKDINTHIAFSEKAIKTVSIIKNRDILLNLLSPIKYSAEKALRDRTETKKFVRSYSK